MKKLFLLAIFALMAAPCFADCPMGLDSTGLGRPPVIEQVWFYGFTDGSSALWLRNICRDTSEVLWWRWYVFACPTGDCEAMRFPASVPWFFPSMKNGREMLNFGLNPQLP